jgi:hypothetical protein
MWSWLKWLLGMAALSAAVFAGSPAHAEEKARLVYSRSPGTHCPAEIELRLSIVARLGYDPFSPQASRVILARVERRARQLIGTVELVDAEGASSGRRELFAARGHCSELARALALSVSLTIDAERTLKRGGTGDSSDGPVQLSPPSSAVEAAPPPSPGPQTPRLFSGGMLGGAQGLLPGFALGATVYVGMGWRYWSVRLETRFMQSFRRDLGDGVTLDGHTIDPSLTGCRSSDRLQVCLVGQLGIIRVRSHGEPDPSTISKTHGSLGPRFMLSFPGDSVSVLLGLESLLNLSANNARMHSREVWRSPVLSATLLVGVETDFL